MATASSVPFLKSSIGRKAVVAASGLFLISFLIAHLSGNLLLFKNDGGAAFNAYAVFMSTNPIIRVLEIVMFGGFLLHIVYALIVSAINRKARPVRYKVNKPGDNSTFYSRFMVYSGLITLTFLLLHLYGFMISHRFLGIGNSMYELVAYKFANPFYSGFYVLSMILLAFHLNHGFQSAFQTFGLQVNKSLYKSLSSFGFLFSVVVPGIFAAMPIYFYLRSINVL